MELICIDFPSIRISFFAFEDVCSRDDCEFSSRMLEITIFGVFERV